MSVATADLHKAINTAWDASGLDATFRALWTAAEIATGDFLTFHDQEAMPDQPFPYCVMNDTPVSGVSRMSGEGDDQLQEIRDIGVTFNVYAGLVDGDSRTAKEIAADLAEEIMKQFGGHPTDAAAQTLSLDNGNVLLVEYQSDYPVLASENIYQWIIEYVIRVDVPVMA